jgi:hypothetical protein
MATTAYLAYLMPNVVYSIENKCKAYEHFTIVSYGCSKKASVDCTLHGNIHTIATTTYLVKLMSEATL